jgi:integron integrase
VIAPISRKQTLSHDKRRDITINIFRDYSLQESPRLLDQVREELQKPHYNRRTEEAYISWIDRFLRFHGILHPLEMGKTDVEAFLSHLVTDQKVAASTQNQALSAVLFLYGYMLGRKLPWLGGVVRAKKPRRLPLVPTRLEVQTILMGLHGMKWLAEKLMYGADLRLLEYLPPRLKDTDFDYRQTIVREGKGDRDRVTILPAAVENLLRHHPEDMQEGHERDLKRGGGYVTLPEALERKYQAANRSWGWQWVFPANRQFPDPSTGRLFRHHLLDTVIQRAVKNAGERARIRNILRQPNSRYAYDTNKEIKHEPPRQGMGCGQMENDEVASWLFRRGNEDISRKPEKR